MAFGGSRPRGSLDLAGARRVAGDLLARRPWTAADLVARLIHRGASAPLARTLVADLVARGHVDDAAFARLWIETRAARGYGPARLRTELRTRGVASDVIDQALARVPPGTALDRARAVARRRRAVLDRLPPDRRAARLRDHLIRRGYDVAVATAVARELAGPERPSIA